MKLVLLPFNLAVCRFSENEQIPDWAMKGGFFSITKTEDELSVVCEQKLVLIDVQSESDWQALKVQGPLDFALTGILSNLASPLAKAKISIFAISTFDTDYILIKKRDMQKAIQILANEGNEIQ